MNVLVTRQKKRSTEFVSLLEESGHRAFVLPLIQTESVEFQPKYDEYDWAVFTSVNAVKHSLEKIKNIKTQNIAAVGDKTAEYLKKEGINVDLIPETFSGSGLLKSFLNIDVIGKKFFLPGPESRSDIFPMFLDMAGGISDVVTAYKTSAVEYEADYLPDYVKENKIDVLTFASPSTVSSFIQNGGQFDGLKVVVIGKPTYDFLLSKSVKSEYPDEYSVKGMVKIINNMIK